MLDDVWAFLRADGESPRKAGHNVMVYRDGAGGLVDVEVGVQVDAPFERAGRVVASATPSGPAARTVHRGSPEGIGAAHDAVVAWCAEHGHRLTRTRWEVYGDWTADPADFETEVCWLLA